MGAPEEAPSIVTLHPATLDKCIQTVDALAAGVRSRLLSRDQHAAVVLIGGPVWLVAFVSLITPHLQMPQTNGSRKTIPRELLLDMKS